MNDSATYEKMPPCKLPDGRVNPEYSAWYRQTEHGEAAVKRYRMKHRMKINQSQKRYYRRSYLDRLKSMTGAVENPVRIQRRRTKGYRLPENTIYVGRPTLWGNPFGFHPDDGGKRVAVEYFRDWLEDDNTSCESERRLAILKHMHLLRGINLACFCDLEEPCHADIYLEVANG